MIAGFSKAVRWAGRSKRFYSLKVLGIESSCDDTSAAVLNEVGDILGEEHFSQSRFFIEMGGVVPNVANEFHSAHVKEVVQKSMTQSGLEFKDLNAIAVTVKPGLILSLQAGLDYARELCLLHKKPLIPIHHMEAHALTCRLGQENVKFPFLAFLISGTHCYLTLVKSVGKFYTLGQSLDNTPGRLIDRVVRRTKMRNLTEYRNLVGGVALENAAKLGNPQAINFFTNQIPNNNCDISLGGLWTAAMNYIENTEKKYNLGPDEVIPNLNDFCACFQWAITKLFCRRLQVALVYLDSNNFFEREKLVVLSGGVAANEFIRKGVEVVCNRYHYKMVAPPPKLCTDNGIMIAWNGIERLKNKLPVVQPDNVHSVTAIPKCTLGEDISEDVKFFASGVKIKSLNSNRILEEITSSTMKLKRKLKEETV